MRAFACLILLPLIACAGRDEDDIAYAPLTEGQIGEDGWEITSGWSPVRVVEIWPKTACRTKLRGYADCLAGLENETWEGVELVLVKVHPEALARDLPEIIQFLRGKGVKEIDSAPWADTSHPNTSCPLPNNTLQRSFETTGIA